MDLEDGAAVVLQSAMRSRRAIVALTKSKDRYGPCAKTVLPSETSTVSQVVVVGPKSRSIDPQTPLERAATVPRQCNHIAHPVLTGLPSLIVPSVQQSEVVLHSKLQLDHLRHRISTR